MTTLFERAKNGLRDWNIPTNDLIQYENGETPLTLRELSELFNNMYGISATEVVAPSWRKPHVIEMLILVRDYAMSELKKVGNDPATETERALDYFSSTILFPISTERLSGVLWVIPTTICPKHQVVKHEALVPLWMTQGLTR